MTRSPLFNETVTAYHRDGAQYVRVVLDGVQWRQKAERLNDNGKLTLVTTTSVTIPEGITSDLSPGDVFVYGAGPELTEEYTIASLKADYSTYCTIRTISDNRNRPRLRHRKATAV